MLRTSTAAALAVLMLGGGSLVRNWEQPSQVDNVSARTQAADAKRQGLNLLFNLDYNDALVKFDSAIKLDPADPAAERFAASVIWMRILFDRGAMLVDDYLGQASSKIDRPPPPADAARDFHIHIAKSIALAEDQLKAHPTDVDAHYQAGATYGFQASYIATVEGRTVGAMGSARRANKEHQRVLELDSKRKDAGLIVGTYLYSVSLLSMPKRWFAYMAGFDSDRARGLKLVEAAASYPSESQPYALFILIVLTSRENRFDDALDAIRRLQQQFPRNRLLWFEEGTAAMRAGKLDVARASFEHGLTMLSSDTRPRAPGEEARWHWSYGSVLVRQKQLEQAGHELQLALAADAPDWVHGRTQLELGKAADLSGQRMRALEAYRTAGRLCRANHDEVCEDEANALMKKPYGAQ